MSLIAPNTLNVPLWEDLSFDDQMTVIYAIIGEAIAMRTAKRPRNPKEYATIPAMYSYCVSKLLAPPPADKPKKLEKAYIVRWNQTILETIRAGVENNSLLPVLDDTYLHPDRDLFEILPPHWICTGGGSLLPPDINKISFQVGKQWLVGVAPPGANL
jgi:hypothetical protein